MRLFSSGRLGRVLFAVRMGRFCAEIGSAFLMNRFADLEYFLVGVAASAAGGGLEAVEKGLGKEKERERFCRAVVRSTFYGSESEEGKMKEEETNGAAAEKGLSTSFCATYAGILINFSVEY